MPAVLYGVVAFFTTSILHAFSTRADNLSHYSPCTIMSATKGGCFVVFLLMILGGTKIVFGYKAMTSTAKIPLTKTLEQNKFHYSVQQYYTGSICSDESTSYLS